MNLHFNEPLRRKIRDKCGHRRENDPAPKSRRIWEGPQGQWMPMGWLSAELPAKVSKPVSPKTVSPLENLMEELSVIKFGDMGRIGTIIPKIDTLETDAEKGTLAKAVRGKMSDKQFKKYKNKEYLKELIAKAGP